MAYDTEIDEELASKADVAAEQAEMDANKTKNFLHFENQCVKAYNILRRNSNKLINLFLIMLSAGMPELKKEEDIKELEIAL
jgi:phosphatidylinositol kinase/protein kinase (PI-3  family)